MVFGQTGVIQKTDHKYASEYDSQISDNRALSNMQNSLGIQSWRISDNCLGKRALTCRIVSVSHLGGYLTPVLETE